MNSKSDKENGDETSNRLQVFLIIYLTVIDANKTARFNQNLASHQIILQQLMVVSHPKAFQVHFPPLLDHNTPACSLLFQN